ncbi:MAG: Di-heme cytochrome c peroxidase [Betaproteobacteria bacterium]|nr:Di-heme cytochrome c peroxidase [Betaproteobacteria bacterium]
MPWPRSLLLVLAAALALLAGACLAIDGAYRWHLPIWTPGPVVPADNPMSRPKVELGRLLFYDKRLSANGSFSCATCHQQSRAFTDGRALALGVSGEGHPRNSMSLANAAYNPVLTWADPLQHALETQALVPMFSTTPVEMGLAGHEAMIARLLADDARYARLFRAAFPAQKQPGTLVNLTRAIAAFERTLLSFDSPYDRYRYGGQADAISPAAKRGERLFFSEQMKCFHCHGGINFTDTVMHQRLEHPEVAFHNTGLYNLDGRGAYPAANTGLMAVTGKAEDMGKFRAPTLRNIAVTAPYMHDGSIATLGEVLDHYAHGGRAAANPLRSDFIRGFVMSAEEKSDLLAFLQSLTDEGFLHNPAFADPYAATGP